MAKKNQNMTPRPDFLLASAQVYWNNDSSASYNLANISSFNYLV